MATTAALAGRLDRIAARGPAPRIVAVPTMEDAERVKLAMADDADRGRLLLVITGVPRSPDDPVVADV